jgi:5-methylcytosine-specific restriction enzyme A
VSPIFRYCHKHGPYLFGPCDQCRREKNAARGTTPQRGYGRQWQKLSKQARELQPYCSVPGCQSTDLTVDHVDPRTRGKPGLTLADVQVLCRFHNSSKGAKAYPVSKESSGTREEEVSWVL